MQTKVLIIRFSAFGDLVLTTGPLAQLRNKFPSLSVEMLTSEIGQEIYINSIDVDHTHIVPKGSNLFQLQKIYKKLDQYDVIIDWQGNFKSHVLKLFQKKATFYKIEKQSKERRAFVKKRAFQEKLNKHVTEKYYDTLKKAFSDLPLKSLEELRPVLPPQPLTFDKSEFDFGDSIAIHPYASQYNKEWPHFEKLCNELIEEGRSVVIVGASKTKLDFPKNKKLLDLTNKTSLREMASILATSKAFVTTDSGPMHMGIAVKTPTLAVFGPTTKEFGFYPQFKNTMVAELNLDCRPCHVHGGNYCPRDNHQCMRELSVGFVKNKLSQLV